MTRIANLLLFVCVLLAAPAVVFAADEASEKKAEPKQSQPAEKGAAAAEEAKPDATESAEPEDGKKQEKAESKEEDAKTKDSAAKKSDKQEKEKGDADKKPKLRKTEKVKKKRLKVDVTLDATFVPREMTEVVLKPEEWSAFKITKVVEHGAEVNEGDVLIAFDDEKLNDTISDLELSQKVSELSLIRAEEELPRLEKSLDMQLESAERATEYAKEDYEEYREEGREQQLIGMDLSMKQFRMALESAREELEQLQKMYDADDLTEETEEIVLKRQRQLVEVYEAYASLIEYDDNRVRDVLLPRSDLSREELLERVDMTLARTKLSHRLDLNAARYSLEKQRRAREKSLERHAKLVADRGLMSVRSPAAGVVYYGRNVKGRWADLAAMLTKLEPEKSVTKNQVLMTIVNPAKLYLAGTVGEKQLPSLAEGQPALIKPAAEGADPMRGAVAMVSDLPVAAGKYGVEIDLKSDDLPGWLDPGMTGKVKVTTYDNKDALVVSAKAIHTDEFDETVKYVWVVTKEEAEEDESDEEETDEDEDEADDEDDDEEEDDDEPIEKVEKRIVKLGKTKGKEVEIVDGVSEGDVLSLEDEGKNEKDAKKKD